MGNDASKSHPAAARSAVPPSSAIPAADSNDKANEISRMDMIIRSRTRVSTACNMKVVIRGAKGSGKTSLWRRLQGLTFIPAVSDNYLNILFHQQEK
jgi:polynucleotide 5'-kinase involved in rRNA processing